MIKNKQYEKQGFDKLGCPAAIGMASRLLWVSVSEVSATPAMNSWLPDASLAPTISRHQLT
jgi:hypothetical protein